MHWCLIGTNEFLRMKILEMIQDRTGIDTVIQKEDPNEIYFLIKSSPLKKIIIFCDVRKISYDVLKKIKLENHHIVWAVTNRGYLEHIPEKVPQENTFKCNDLNEERFVVFIRGVLKEFGISLSEDEYMYLAERLDRGDLYQTHSELVKLGNHFKTAGKILQKDLKWIGNPKKKTTLDLFNDFLRKRETTLKTFLNLEHQEIPPLQILAFFLEAVEKVIYIKSFMARGGEIKELAGQLNAHPYFLTKLQELSSKITLPKLLSWHKRLCQLDIGMKYTGLDGYILLRSFLLEELA